MFAKKSFIISLLALILGLNVFWGVTAQGAGDPDETVIAVLLQNTLTTTMLFTGGNDDWDCSYRVVDTVAASSTADSATERMKFVLTPLFSGGDSRYIKYIVQTSGGRFSGEQWLQTGQAIQIEANTPIPVSGETIPVEVTECDETTGFDLTNVIPDAAIAPERVFRKTFEVYYATYGVYPTTRFSFAIDFLAELNAWLVTFDDNDGVGGQGFLLIDAITGEAGAIKEDEG